MTIKAKNITNKELIQAFVDASKEGSNIHYGFLLGAGASIASKIPGAEELGKKWLKEIELTDDEKDWKDNPAQHYSKIFSKRFKANPELGSEELQSFIDKATPSIGYLFLAQILTKTRHNAVLTTNFDSMTEDALFSVENSRPLIIGHESLVEYLPARSINRPVIVKLHRDYLLNPKNDSDDLKTLPNELKDKLNSILRETYLIVVGYGGNDESVINYLKNNKDRKPIYWCCRDKDKLSTEVSELLTKDDFIVEIKGFDNFMLLLNKACREKIGFETLIDKNDPKESSLVKNAIEKVENYQEQMEKLITDDSTPVETKELLTELLPDWWAWQLKVDEAKEDNDKNKLYLDGLKQYPDSCGLNNNYALFLENIRKEYDKAEEYYQKALALEPNDAIINNNYANFLKNIRKEHDKAEGYYQKALALDPNHVHTNGNYANFLTEIRKEHSKAEKYYQKALALEPNHANINGNYANFLKNIRKEHDKAEKYYQKALALEPNHAIINGNYAGLLLALGKKPQANNYLDNAFKYLESENDLIVELWFYRLAHYPEYRQEAIKQLDGLIAKGFCSIGWDLSLNIKQAEKEGFEPIALLQKYVDKITTIKK